MYDGLMGRAKCIPAEGRLALFCIQVRFTEDELGLIL